MSLIKRINELRSQRELANKEARRLLDESRAAGDFPADKKDAYYRALTDVEKLDERIADLEAAQQEQRAGLPPTADLPPNRAAELALEQRAVSIVRTRGGLVGPDGEPLLNDDERVAYERAYSRSFMRYVRFGSAGVRPEDFAALQTRQQSMEGVQMRDQSTTAAAGGYTIAEEWASNITRAMLAFGGIEAGVTYRGVRRGPTILNTSTMADLHFPTNNDTGNSGALLAEADAVPSQDTTFAEVILQGFMFTSKLIKASVQILQDSAFDLAGYIGSIAGERLGRAYATEYATGSGSSRPRGITVAVSSGKTAAAAAAFTYNELLDLKHSVDPAYRPNGAWVMKDSSFLLVKKLQDSTGFPLWQPSPVVGEPPTLDGDPYIIDQAFPAATTGLKPIVYGDLSKYYIRKLGAPFLVRLEELYMGNLQKGFFVFQRMDADLVDGGGGAAKCLTMA